MTEERSITSSIISDDNASASDSEESLTDVCETKKLKDIILDTDEEDRYEKYIRLTDDNVDNIEHTLAYTFDDYAIINEYSGEEVDETEYEYYRPGRMIRNAEGILQNKDELHLMKRREKLVLLRKLKAEIRRKMRAEKNNQLFKKPKWWMYLMKSGTDIIKRNKMKPFKPKADEFWKFNKKNAKVGKDDVNIADFLAKRSKRRGIKREKRALLCVDFWETLEKQRKDLMKMMLAVQLKKYMIKTRKAKEDQLMGRAPKPTIPRKQCIRLLKKNFKSIIGATDEEVKMLKTKLNEVKDLFKKRTDWTEDHLISLMNLCKKVSAVDKNKNSLKEEVINYYIDGIYCMMDLHLKLAQDIRAATIRNPKIYNKAYRIMKTTEIFISEQLLIFRYLRNVLLHAEWTYLYYARMRVIRKLDDAIRRINCQGYRLKRKSVERLEKVESDCCNEIICDEPKYENENVDHSEVGRMIHTKHFCPISNHSIF